METNRLISICKLAAGKSAFENEPAWSFITNILFPTPRPTDYRRLPVDLKQLIREALLRK